MPRTVAAGGLQGNPQPSHTFTTAKPVPYRNLGFRGSAMSPKHNEARLRELLKFGPLTTRDLQAATGMSNPGVHKRLRSMESRGQIVSSRTDDKNALLWALSASHYEDVDAPLTKRKHGFGTNPPGEALVKAWQ
jgi:hypothetical protein